MLMQIQQTNPLTCDNGMPRRRYAAKAANNMHCVYTQRFRVYDPWKVFDPCLTSTRHPMSIRPIGNVPLSGVLIPVGISLGNPYQGMPLPSFRAAAGPRKGHEAKGLGIAQCLRHMRVWLHAKDSPKVLAVKGSPRLDHAGRRVIQASQQARAACQCWTSF
jgi:hypothetical protein